MAAVQILLDFLQGIVEIDTSLFAVPAVFYGQAHAVQQQAVQQLGVCGSPFEMLSRENICQGGFHHKDEIPLINWNSLTYVQTVFCYDTSVYRENQPIMIHAINAQIIDQRKIRREVFPADFERCFLIAIFFP